MVRLFFFDRGLMERNDSHAAQMFPRQSFQFILISKLNWYPHERIHIEFGILKGLKNNWAQNWFENWPWSFCRAISLSFPAINPEKLLKSVQVCRQEREVIFQAYLTIKSSWNLSNGQFSSKPELNDTNNCWFFTLLSRKHIVLWPWCLLDASRHSSISLKKIW